MSICYDLNNTIPSSYLDYRYNTCSPKRKKFKRKK